MRGLFECGYTYGWRISELENLRLRQVSLLARTIRLDAGTTKNDEPRIVKMTDAIYGLLGQCMAGKQPHDYVSRDRTPNLCATSAIHGLRSAVRRILDESLAHVAEMNRAQTYAVHDAR